MKRINVLFVYFSILFTLFGTTKSFADGSKDMYPSGATGKRAFMLSSQTDAAFNPFATQGTTKVFAKVGETIYVGSSAGNAAGRIVLTRPNSSTQIILSATDVTSGNGVIQNRAQELAGPRTATNTGGYKPLMHVVAAGEEGIWIVNFISPLNGVGGTDNNALNLTVNVNANDAWAQPDGTDGTNAFDGNGVGTTSGTYNSGSLIAAWDVSIGSVADAKVLVPGRVYTNLFAGTMVHDGSGLYASIFVLTDDGFTYRVSNNGQNGQSFNFFSNNKGAKIVSGTTASYKSLNSSTLVDIQARISDPRSLDASGDVTHKLFYKAPATDMPATSVIRNGASTVSTWLKPVRVNPEMTTPTFIGSEGTPQQAGSKGGNVSFTSNINGIYRITIPLASPFTSRVLSGPCVIGSNTVYWDGKDANGTKVTSGTSLSSITAQLFGAEVHFPFIDVEVNPNGFLIELLTNTYTSISPVENRVYWNDIDIVSTNTNPSNPQQNGNDPGTSAALSGGNFGGFGVPSTLNGHKWGNYVTANADSHYGNNKTMDTWAYAPGESKTISGVVIEIKEADLQVNNVTTPSTLVSSGDVVTYTVGITNAGPIAVTGAKPATFWFYVPEGVTIVPANVTFTSSNGAVLSSTKTFDAVTRIFKVAVDMPVSSTGTFTIPVNIGTLTGANVNVYAAIMRPNDVSDPNATNPSLSIPAPRDPFEEATLIAYAPATGNNFTPNATQITRITDGTTTNNIKQNPNVNYLRSVCIAATLTLPAATGGSGSTTWTSATPGTATVNSSGVVTGVAAGDVVITRTKSGTTTTTFTIRVKPAVGAVAVGTVTQTTCSIATGSVALSGLPATGTWTITDSFAGTSAITGTGTTTTISGLAVGTHTFTISNGSCSRAVTPNVVINAQPSAPSTPAIGAITQPTCAVSTGSVVLNGLPATGTWTINPGAITGTGTTHTISGLAPGTYNYTVTNDAGCTSVASSNVVVNAVPNALTTPTVGTITQPTLVLATGSVVLSGLPATGTWTITNSNGGGTITGTGTSTTISGLAQGTHTFTVSHASGCTSTATANVVINSAPIANPDVNSTNEEVTLTVTDGAVGDILLNDTDVNGNNTVSVSKYTITGIAGDQTLNSTVTIPSIGTINIQANGSYVFVPALNYNGVVPVINYTISDGVLTASSTLTITVNPVNDIPVATPDVNNTNKNTTLTIVDGAAGDILLNDTDVDAGTTLVVTKFTVPGLSGDQSINATITLPSGAGTINIQANGSYIYIPANEFTGTVPVITYTISDGNGGNASSTLSLTVNQTNVAPVPVANTNTMLEDGTAINVAAAASGVTGGLLANDTDANNDVLTITNFTVNGVVGNQTIGGSGYAITNVGTIIINANGSYSFTPLANYNGAVSQITYTVFDGTTSATSTLDITVTPVNDVPSFTKGVDFSHVISAAPAAQTVATWATALGKGPANESGQTLSFITSNDKNALFSSQPTIDASGQLTYTVTANTYGKATVTVAIKDNGGTTNGGVDTSPNQTFIITVKPVGVTDTYTTPRNTAITSTVSGNDGASGVGTTVVAGATTPSHGAIVVNGNGTITYTPTIGYIGTDTYTYILRTPDGVDSDPIVVNITITNTPPTTNDRTNAVIASNTAVPVDIINPTGADADGTVTGYTITSLPTTGTLYLANGTTLVTLNQILTQAEADGLKFKPSGTGSATVTFTLAARDNDGAEDATPATITIPLTNTPPTTDDKTNTAIASNTAVPVDIINPTGADVDGTVTGYKITSLPTSGTLYLADGTTAVTLNQILTQAEADGLKFKPSGTGSATVTFTLAARDNDGAEDATPATITIPLTNTPPTTDDKTNTAIASNTAVPVDIINPTGADVDGTVTGYKITGLPTSGTLYLADGTTAVTLNQILTQTEADGLKFKPSGTTNTAATFTLAARDNDGLEDATPATITIPLTNTPPTTHDKTNTAIASNTAVPVDIINPTGADVDGTVTGYKVTSLPTSGTLYLADGTTAVTLNQILTQAEADGLKFKPSGTGSATVTFTLAARDNDGAEDATPATITIPLTNTPPTTDDKINTTIASNTAVPVDIINPTGADTDGTVTGYTITSLPTTGTLYLADGTTAVTLNQILTQTEANGLKFKPSGTTNTAVTFTLAARDNDGAEDATPATITIPLTNTPPTTDDKTNTAIASNTAVPVDIVNPTGADVDGTVTSYKIVTLPTSGTLYLADGTTAVTLNQILTQAEADGLKFKPSGTTNTAATFTLAARDNDGAEDVTPATITIPLTNTPPTTDDKTNTAIASNTAVPVDIVNPTGADVDGTVTSYKIVTLPTSGTLYLADGTTAVTLNQILTQTDADGLKFKPSGTGNATVTFTIAARDNDGAEDVTPATITIPLTNTPPTTDDKTNTAIASNTAVPVDIINPTGADVDGTVTGYTIASLPTSGTLYLADGTTAVTLNQILTQTEADGLKFKPSGTTNTAATFTLAARDNDGAEDVTPATITIPLTNTPPTTDDKTNTTIASNTA
ncbi:MAG: tandem-95 repeat protein, partial [Bacteroidota bacterium]